MPIFSDRRSLCAGTLLPACAGVWLALCSPAAQANFEIEQATTRNVDGVYHLDAEVKYALTAPVREALANGVALEFELQVDVLERNEVLWDSVFATLTQRYRLEYHELSQQYVIENRATEIVEAFASLASALRRMGRVSEFPVVDSSLLDPAEQYSGRLRVSLALDELPLPIRARAYLSSAWRLDSDWYPLELK